ncbi:hypothetical protein, partial [Okeania sp. SIO3B5]|uniref:hypothetical protein n=1 Tax=Okeania sp. SIO3B5 TaxID=2607811 RepID=UPI0025D9F7FB
KIKNKINYYPEIINYSPPLLGGASGGLGGGGAMGGLPVSSFLEMSNSYQQLCFQIQRVPP